MSVSNSTVYSISTANGVSTTFMIPFDWLLGTTSSVVKVYRIDATTGEILQTYVESTDFDFDPPEDVLNVVLPTSVVFLSAPANGTKIMIRREVPYTQPVSYINNSGFLATDHEKCADNLDLQIQQLAEQANRALVSSVIDSGIDMVLPSVVGNAGRCLILNDDEDGWDWGPVAGDLTAAIAAAEAAQAAAEAAQAQAESAQAGAEAAEQAAEDAVADAEAAVVDAEAAQAAAEAAQAAAEAAQAAAEAAATASNVVVVGTRLAPITVATSGTVAIGNYRRQKIYLAGDGGAVTNVSLADGNQDGDELLIVFCDDTNQVTIPHGNNTKQNGSIVGAADYAIRYSWDLADWVEIGRNI